MATATPPGSLPSLEIAVEREGGTSCITLSGQFDDSGAARFGQEFRSLMTEPSLANLILDMRCIDAIDSSGLDLVRSTWERSREDGFNLILVRASSRLRPVFELSGLDQLLPIVYEQPGRNGRP